MKMKNKVAVCYKNYKGEVVEAVWTRDQFNLVVSRKVIVILEAWDICAGKCLSN